VSADSSHRGELSPAQVFALADLVSYQDGAVVSRTLIDKPSGTLTLFSFAENQGLSEHQAPCDAVVYVLDGKVSVTISGSRHDVGAGQMIVMPANEPHSLKAESRFKMLLVMIKS
jgi:quercetin dioxygenase-like cupin family protein